MLEHTLETLQILNLAKLFSPEATGGHQALADAVYVLRV